MKRILKKEIEKSKKHSPFFSYVGVDRSKMRLFDVDPNEQTLTDDTPVFDKSESKEKMSKFKDWNI